MGKNLDEIFKLLTERKSASYLVSHNMADGACFNVQLEIFQFPVSVKYERCTYLAGQQEQGVLWIQKNPHILYANMDSIIG